MKSIIIACFLFTLFFFSTGCATTSQKVYLPVYKQPNIDLPQKPVLAISTIKKTDKCQEVMKKYVVSLNQACAYAKQEEILLLSIKK